jgi:2,5-diamino-6-(ribosylamino)-4(3H)-pyrimidinone 5'-phosphate reductase
MARPRVIVHTAVSLDGAGTGFEPDQTRFYELISTWDEDVTLAGSQTIMAQEPALASAPRPGPAANGPLLAVVDGRGRVKEWEALRDCGHWSGTLALRSQAAPASRARPERELVLGAERVDLAAALAALAADGAREVRVDSGPGLIGALLDADLVDEVSLLVHPLLARAGGAGRGWAGDGRPSRALAPTAAEMLGDGLAWLRYELRR